jgi:hypothetical protein
MDPNRTPKRAKTRLYNSGPKAHKSPKSKINETKDPNLRKGGVSCATFKRDREAFPLFRCVYIGVSGGHQRPVAGTLTKLTRGLKCKLR